MKTNKLWSIILMLVLVLSTAVAFSSCSKDDDDNDNENATSIYGTWSDTRGQDRSIWYVYTFKKNGSLDVCKYVDYYENNTVISTQTELECTGDYTYGNGIVTLRFDGRMLTRIIIQIDKNKLTWMDEYGETAILNRQ